MKQQWQLHSFVKTTGLYTAKGYILWNVHDISILRKAAKPRRVETKGGHSENGTGVTTRLTARSSQALAAGEALGKRFNINKLSYLILTATL